MQIAVAHCVRVSVSVMHMCTCGVPDGADMAPFISIKMHDAVGGEYWLRIMLDGSHIVHMLMHACCIRL